MHELALAQTLIEQATAALPPTQVEQVTQVRVRLGPLAGVSADELAFGFTVAATDTLFATAQLVIEPTPLVIYCPRCAASHLLTQIEPLACPNCASPAVQVMQGKELLLASLAYTSLPGAST